MKWALTTIAIFLFSNQNIFAGDISLKTIQANAVGEFKVGIGSNVFLNTSDKSLNGPGLFLGSAVNPSGENTYQLILNSTNKKVFYIDSTEFTKRNSTLSQVLDPYEQKGGTCTGYAIFDFLQQMNLQKFVGNGKLSETLKDEEGRSQLLADSINQYYLTLSHRFSINGIMNSYGKQFGFSCRKFQFDDATKARQMIIEKLKSGLPIIFSFNIGPNMYNSPFKISKYPEKNGELDDRLWIPRKTGERNNGGHSIVAAGYFSFENKNYAVMIDSDWSEPRIWDLDKFIDAKTAMDEIEFVTCK